MVEDVAPAYRQVEELTEPVMACGRSHAGFNPASGADVKLFSAVLDGNHLVRGFRNADIPEALYESSDEAGERRRQSHTVGRMLKRLHVRVDCESPAQPTVARQPQRPPGARGGGPTVSLWYPGRCRASGVIHHKDARTAQRSYRGRI